MDGASDIQRFWRVIVPHLRPALILGLVLSFLGTFGDFAIIELVTRGGPIEATQTLPTLAMQTNLYGTDVGSAAAIALSFLPVYAVGLVLLAREVKP